jgi:hypothetical protein
VSTPVSEDEKWVVDITRAGSTSGVELSLYKRKFFLLSEAVQVTADRLASERGGCANTDALIDDARKQLLEALFEGAIVAEGVMRHSTRYPVHEPPIIECDEWVPIAQGLWSHERCNNYEDSVYGIDKVIIAWSDNYVEHLDKRNGEIVECARIRLLRADIDREFPAREPAALGFDSLNGPVPKISRTGVAGRPTSKHLVKCEMERRAKEGRLASSLAGEVRELRDWLQRQYPTVPQLTQSALQNALRCDYRRLKG